MEITQLKYFLSVAQTGNLNKAAEKISISPGSLSKAISKLENELEVKLFERVGRNIKITEAGLKLKDRSLEIINLEEKTRLEISGSPQVINATICGEELLVSKYGVEMASLIHQKHPLSRIKLMSSQDKVSTRKIRNGEAQIAFTTEKPSRDFLSKKIDQVIFSTCIGKKHPLYKYVRKNQIVNIEEVLKYSFVIPSENILGQTKNNQSVDGWRDDKFPRRKSYHASSIKVVESLVLSGNAIAYLPTYLSESLDVGILKIEGCPYYCEQKIYAYIKKPIEIGWLNQIW